MYKLSLRTPSIHRTPVIEETMSVSDLEPVELVQDDRIVRVLRTECWGVSSQWCVEVEGKGVFVVEAREVVLPYPAPETPVIAPFRTIWVDLDGCFDDQAFQCYTEGKTWNGAECPRFTKEWADRLMAADVNAIVKFDPATDTYDFGSGEIVDDPENHTVVKGHDIVVDGQTIHVYAIGASSWCWTEAKPPRLPYSDNVVITGFAGCITVEDEDGKNLIPDTVFTTVDDALKAAHKLVWAD